MLIHSGRINAKTNTHTDRLWLCFVYILFFAPIIVEMPNAAAAYSRTIQFEILIHLYIHICLFINSSFTFGWQPSSLLSSYSIFYLHFRVDFDVCLCVCANAINFLCKVLFVQTLLPFEHNIKKTRRNITTLESI